MVFQVLVQIFNHHDRAINHRTHSDRNAAEGHNVGIQPLGFQDQQRDDNAKWQTNDRD